MTTRIIFLNCILVFVILLLFHCKTDKTPTGYEISRSEAATIVLNQIVASDTMERGVYLFPEIINNGNRVYSVLDSGHCVHYSSWFFFIDDMIAHDFGHPCRFVFVNCGNGNYEIFHESWPPKFLWENRMEIVKEWSP